jgi:hypothetical protein
MKLMHASILNKKTGMVLSTVLIGALLAIGFFAVAPSITAVQAATAIESEIQGCSGSSAPPQLSQLSQVVPTAQSNWLQGWSIKSFSLGSLSMNDGRRTL